MAHGVPGGLADRLDQGIEVLVHRSVAGDDELDRHAVEVLDLLEGGGQRGPKSAGTCVLVVEVRPQLPLLGPGKPRHGRRVGGTPLDQGQGLQHRVVQVRRDVGTLSGADAGRLLVSEIAPEAEDPRCGEDGNADEGGEDRADHLPGSGPRRSGR